MSKSLLKQQAIAYRHQGLTYAEILLLVPVAKSTLSLWLRDVGLAKRQAQRITQKKITSSKRGAEIRKKDRIKRAEEIYQKARFDIGTITKKELFLIGVVLYWAEGSKEKQWHPGTGVEFTNSDPLMIAVFIKWLLEVAQVNQPDLVFEIYIHKAYEQRLEEVRRFWSLKTGFPLESFQTIYWKKHTTKTIRKNIGNMYNGNLRIRVKASSILLRKIHGWIQGICSILVSP